MAEITGMEEIFVQACKEKRNQNVEKTDKPRTFSKHILAVGETETGEFQLQRFSLKTEKWSIVGTFNVHGCVAGLHQINEELYSIISNAV